MRAALIGGESVTFAGPAAARAAGIAVIYQEPTLFPDLSVAENIFMGRQPVRTARRIDRGAMSREAAAIFTQLGVVLDPGRPARGLSVADQQIVEIAKALSLEARVLVMDEPTAALTNVEVDRLFQVIAALRRRGAAVLFISHRLEEVFAICQRVTIMRDGRFVLTAGTDELDVDTMIRAMIGRELGAMFHKTGVTPGEVVLDGRAPGAGERLLRHQLRRPARRDRRAGRAGGRGAHRGRPGRSSGSTGAPRVRCGCSASPCRPASRPRRWRRGSRSCPRTAGSRAWSWTWGSTTTSRWPRWAG